MFLRIGSFSFCDARLLKPGTETSRRYAIEGSSRRWRPLELSTDAMSITRIRHELTLGFPFNSRRPEDLGEPPAECPLGGHLQLLPLWDLVGDLPVLHGAMQLKGQLLSARQHISPGTTSCSCPSSVSWIGEVAVYSQRLVLQADQLAGYSAK